MPRNILAAVDDMFFAAKIRATAEALALASSFIGDLNPWLAQPRNSRRI